MAPLKKHAELDLGIPQMSLSRSKPFTRDSELDEPMNLVPQAMQLEPDSFNKDAEVPHLPEMYSFHTSVVSAADRESILHGLENVIKPMTNTQYEINQRNYKVRGVAIVEDRVVKFVINMFATGQDHQRPNHILLEFQRRDGDAWAFQVFYRSIVNQLKQLNLVHYGANKNNEALPQPLPMLSMQSEEFGQLDFSRDPAMPKHLLAMCGSKYLEPRREATGILARGSRVPANIGLIAALGVPALLTLGNLTKECHDLEIARNSAAVLKNIFTHDTSIRYQAHKQSMFKALCKTFLKWSGAADINEVSASTLVCQELCEALEKLAQDSDMMRQNISAGDLKDLEKVAKKSSYQQLAMRAQRLVGLVTS